MGRLEARLSLARLVTQLGLRLSRPARQVGYASAKLGSARPGSAPSAGRFLLLPGLGFLSSLPFLLAGLALRLLLARAGGVVLLPLSDSAAPGVGLRWIPCGDARIRCAGGRARVRVSAEARVRVLRPKSAREKASTAGSRRERDVAFPSRGWARTAEPWRGRGETGAKAAARLGLGVRTHARGLWFSRAAAWPCRARGTGDPGPRHDAAARGGDGGGGKGSRRDGLLQRTTARRPEGREFLRPLQRVHRLGRQQRGREEVRRPWRLPAG
jgi:hypothetical protein